MSPTPGPSVEFPFGLGRIEGPPSAVARRAAWSLYVELVTRIGLGPSYEDSGRLRESLSALHSLFRTTREVLKEAGPEVGRLGEVAIGALNQGLRPFLGEWHPALAEHEALRPPESSAREHEQSWSRAGELAEALTRLRGELGEYALALSRVAGTTTA